MRLADSCWVRSIMYSKFTKENFKQRLHEVIFESETPAGKFFDIGLFATIVLSILAVVLESVESIEVDYGELLRVIEWAFTIIFTAEYLLRIFAVKHPLRYVFSFFGLIDLLSILPAFLGLFIEGSRFLMVVRSMRLLRIFRVLKLARYLSEAQVLATALRASRYKISVFLGFVMIITTIIGTLMYIIEGPESGFTSIPRGIYWAIVTLTTVGYGDITPNTPIGQVVSSLIMILGYGVLAVPTGIVSVELSRVKEREISNEACPGCSAEGHDTDAKFCKYCGESLKK